MKPLWIILIAIAIIGSFFAGKYIGQSGYQNEQRAEPVAATPPADTVLHHDSVSAQTSDVPSPFAPAQSSVPSPTTESTSQNFSERIIEEPVTGEPDDTGALSYAERRKRALEQYPEAQRELDDWSAVHEEVLNQQMATVFGDKDYNAKVMYDSVSENNPLLSKPLAESSQDEDIAWRSQAKANLEYFFLTHIDDPDFKILDIYCLQKKCEVTLTGRDIKQTYSLVGELLTDNAIRAKNVSHVQSLILQDTNYWSYMLVYF